MSFKKFTSFSSNRSVILPKLSLNLIPLYKPIEINRKKVKDKIVVEINEFLKSELCSPRPKIQTERMVNAITIRVIIKIFRELIIL